MRRLAAELDTGAAPLYVHVRNTAELHAAMLEELLGQIDLSPVTASGDWQERLIEVLASYTAILFEHPGLAQSAPVTGPSGPANFGLVDGLRDAPADRFPHNAAIGATELMSGPGQLDWGSACWSTGSSTPRGRKRRPCHDR
jgi:AcrR family transcriptional regulator